MARARGVRLNMVLEISFTLLLFHRSILVEINYTRGALALCGSHHFLHDFLNRIGFALDGTSERPASEGAEADFPHLNLVFVLFRQAFIVWHDELPVHFHDRTLFSEVQRYDGDVFKADILPNVQLCPVAQREHAYAFALVDTSVINVPEFRTLVFGIPLLKLIAGN